MEPKQKSARRLERLWSRNHITPLAIIPPTSAWGILNNNGRERALEHIVVATFTISSNNAGLRQNVGALR